MGCVVASEWPYDSYTLQEFADDQRISVSSVKNLIAAGKLTKTYVTENKPVITVEEAERFKASRRTSERPAP
jgi:hypothetical protein